MLVGGGPAVVEHDQSILSSETRLVGELGVASWLAIGAILPFRIFNTHIRYVDPSTGSDVKIVNPYVHHHNEMLVGPGDPWLVARAATALGGIALSLRLGTTIPIGSTVPDPFALGDRGIAHEHTQFGTGIFAPIAGIEASRAIGRVALDAYALTVQALYDNHHGYRPGNRYALGVGAASDLGTARWRFRATIERTSETAERWGGMVHTTEGNIGRVDVLAGVEAAYRITDDWRAALSVKLPVYSRVVGGQVDTPLFASLTISAQAHLWTPPHVHAHAPPAAGAAPGADWSGLDEAEVSSDGSAAPLVPVAGKLTVFDFWADWCQPCRELDHRLAELARRHPELAVRKVNVIDDDTPAWRAYLAPGGFNLPHVKLYGRDGALLWERSGDPAELAAAIESVIESAIDAAPGAQP